MPMERVFIDLSSAFDAVRLLALCKLLATFLNSWMSRKVCEIIRHLHNGVLERGCGWHSVGSICNSKRSQAKVYFVTSRSLDCSL